MQRQLVLYILLVTDHPIYLVLTQLNPMKRTINRLRVSEFIGNDARAAESRNNRGPHASCAFQGIYLPYICHVPNCITRYVGFLYKMALRSHRLCCHRSICRGVLLSSLIFLPPFHSLSLPLSFSSFLPVPLSLTYTHKSTPLCTLAIWFAAPPFIHNTPCSKSSASPRRPV